MDAQCAYFNINTLNLVNRPASVPQKKRCYPGLIFALRITCGYYAKLLSGLELNVLSLIELSSRCYIYTYI